MLKIKELKSLPKEDLKSKLIELRMELIKQNAQIATGTTPKNPGQIKETKKTIARIISLIEKQKNKEE